MILFLISVNIGIEGKKIINILDTILKLNSQSCTSYTKSSNSTRYEDKGMQPFSCNCLAGAALLVYNHSVLPNKTSPKLKLKNHVVDLSLLRAAFLKFSIAFTYFL